MKQGTETHKTKQIFVLDGINNNNRKKIDFEIITLSLENSLQSLLLDAGKDGQDLNSAAPSAGRRADIYVGVDVFGRGCLGGGGKGDELSSYFPEKNLYNFFYQCRGSALVSMQIQI
jgi:hypothetical protein